MPQHTPTDRITQLLTKNTPRIQDVARAFLEASTGKKTYSDALNAQRAMEIDEAKTLYDVFSKERESGMRQEEFKLKKEELKLTREKMLFDQIREANKDVADAIEFMVPNETARDDLIRHLDQSPTEINAANVYQEVSKAIPILQSQGVKIDKPKEPPTGYRYNEMGFLEMDPGYLQGEMTAYEAKKRIDLKYEDAAGAAGFGDSLDGIAMTMLRDAQLKAERGIALTPEERINIQLAASHLTQPRMQAVDEDNGQGGIKRSFYEVTPSLPLGIDLQGMLGGAPTTQPDVPTPGFFTPPTAPAAQPQAQAAPSAAGQPGIKQIGAVTKQVGSLPVVLHDIVGALTILEEAAKAGEKITGTEGWAKAWGGGFARGTLGMDISPRAENLSRTLKSLALSSIKSYITESNPSTSERAKIDDIIGKISIATDDVTIINSLDALLAFLEVRHGNLSGAQ